MKIALILSGSVRNIEDTFDSMEYYFLNKFQNIDVFFYGCENVFGREKNIDFLTKKFSPKKIVVNEKSFYTDEIGLDILSKKNHHTPSPSHWNKSIWAFYNVMMCNQLKKEYESENNFEYDLVIRSRMDLFWFREVNKDEIEMAKDSVVIPWDWAFRSGPPWNGRYPFGYSDFYAISNNNLFNFYADAYKYINEFSSIYPYAPESLLGFYLKDKPVKEVRRHVISEYPIIQREGIDSNGDPLPGPYFHPKVWDGEKDFGSTNIHHIGGLRVRYD
jgi:hypothetical protein